MVKFEFGGKEFYIDGRLKARIDNKVIKELTMQDKDIVFCVDGAERSGKSVFSMVLGAYASTQLKTEFNISNICLTADEFRHKVATANKNEVIVYDEAHRGMGSRRALSEINKLLVDLMMEMGQRNLFIIIVLPTFFMLDRYPALFRTKGLFHIYERKGKRGFWVYFNSKNKQRLFVLGKKLFNYNCMHWPYFRGRFLNQYPVDEDEYRKKKGLSFQRAERLTRDEKYLEQRNKALYIMHKEFKLSLSDMEKLCTRGGLPLKSGVLSVIFREIEGKPTQSSILRGKFILNTLRDNKSNQDEGNEEEVGDENEEVAAEDDI